MSQYERLKIYSIDEVLRHTEFTGRKVEHEFDGHLIKMNSLRYQTFAKKGVQCVRCGLVGTYFAMEKSKYQEGTRYHFNLYGIDDQGNEVMLTKDHILPRSRGGSNNVEKNLQTLCTRCNMEKGCMTEAEYSKKSVKKKEKRKIPIDTDTQPVLKERTQHEREDRAED